MGTQVVSSEDFRGFFTRSSGPPSCSSPPRMGGCPLPLLPRLPNTPDKSQKPELLTSSGNSSKCCFPSGPGMFALQLIWSNARFRSTAGFSFLRHKSVNCPLCFKLQKTHVKLSEQFFWRPFIRLVIRRLLLPTPNPPKATGEIHSGNSALPQKSFHLSFLTAISTLGLAKVTKLVPNLF